MAEEPISIARRRMAHQGLCAPLGGPEAIVDAVRAMCGAHAQVQQAAEHSVARRLEGVTRADVQEALWQRRDLVRTYGPRGTVHLLPSADLHLWSGALSALDGGTPRHADGVRLEDDQVDEVVAAVGEALADAELTLPELDAEIAARLGPWASERTMPAFQTLWPRWRQAITVAAHRGALCFGRPRGRSATYTSPARWLPGFAPAPAAVAVPWLVESYAAAYGPSEPRHLARWLATSESWAAGAWARSAPDEPTSPPGSAVESIPEILLLPYFDAYVVAAQPREELFPGRAWDRALAGSQAGNYPVLLVDGVVGGVWHGKRSGSRIAVRVEPLATLTDRQRLALEDEVARVGEILQARTELTVGRVSVGPHA
ncbi:winged helix DNA-binding domain-containing protein [Pseudactinotalea terrae]|uniref:winged helix DNA-binding domain-containing protein n=1 Tax=Pseudactinotalea terrae TaxID=1743262 RepID=UPI001390E980|nr:winged helix DNA-binding domain-containing protein [Pseudactinotalea terrae]